MAPYPDEPDRDVGFPPQYFDSQSLKSLSLGNLPEVSNFPIETNKKSLM